MSVVGFDIGNDTSCVALARKRGIDVLMNKESKRETPSCVCFGEKMRYLGTDALAKLAMNPTTTIHQLKRIIGKKFKDPAVQSDVAKLPFKIVEGPDGGCLIDVMYCNEKTIFTPEQVMAMVLVDQKRIAEMESGITVTDCAIAVPTYYTEAERYAMLSAATIAGLNCLRLINENTATALAYGIYKTDLPDTEPVHVAFVDVGHSSTQVSIVGLKKGQLIVKSHSWDRDLGGRDFDEVLYDHFCEEFKTKYKIDVVSNAKASFKLRQACEKMKKVLSANSEAILNIECLMDDKDVKGTMTRENFEKMCEPLLARFKAPLQKALDIAGITIDAISSVEIIGSSTRTPALYKIVEDFFGKAPSRTMHSKECVSRGAALQCAMLSPVFKVREFEVIDSFPFGIDLVWEKDGAPATQRVFDRGNQVPSSKLLTFLRSEPFTLTASYSQDSDVPVTTDRKIGEYYVGPIPVQPGQEKAKLKVKVRLNLHGLFGIESVQVIEEEEYEEVSTKPVEAPATPATAAGEAVKDEKMEDASSSAPEAAANGTAEAMETEAKPAAPAVEKVVEKKKRVKRVDIPHNVTLWCGQTNKQIEDLFEKEGQMQAADKLQEETNEKKNALESYVYDMRNKLCDQYAGYVTEADKESFSAALQTMEDWLYDEGEDVTKSVYIEKLKDLKVLGDPIELRYHEEHSRASAATQLQQLIEYYQGILTMPQYAHLSQADKDQVAKECETAKSWLEDKVVQQSKLSKTDTPAVLTADIHKKRDVLDRVCKPIVTKPPPPPPKAAENKPAEPAPMEADTPTGDTPEATPNSAPEVDMDPATEEKPMEQ